MRAIGRGIVAASARGGSSPPAEAEEGRSDSADRTGERTELERRASRFPRSTSTCTLTHRAGPADLIDRDETLLENHHALVSEQV